MRGQSYNIAVILVVFISIVLSLSYYFFSQQLFVGATTSLAAEIDRYRDLASQYLSISSATAKLEGNLAEFTVRIVNQGDSDVLTFSNSNWYVYKDGVVVASGYASCPPRITPDNPCTLVFNVLSPELQTRDDFYHTEVTVYVNEVPLTSTVSFIGSFPGASLYQECYSCSECSSLISSASPNTLIVVHPSGGSAGCLDIDGAKGVTIYCASVISGSGTGIGISIRNSSGVELRSCEVTGYNVGIYIENSTRLSFRSVYSHNNNAYDFYVSPNTLNDVCTFGTVDVAATSGPIRFFNSYNNTAENILSVSAIWVVNSGSISLSGYPTPVWGVSPAIVVCNSSDTRISDFNVSATDVGVFLTNDTGTRLESLDVQSNMYGILSESSVGGYICCSTFHSPGSDLFRIPSSVEWDSQTVFTG